MKEVKEYPPNIAFIRQFFPVDDPKYNPLFPWGETLYNPRGIKIPEDVLYHEEIHRQQQQNDSEGWWQKYCLDKSFRLKEETEAYHKQWQWVRKHIGAKAGEEALEEMATNLSSTLYDLQLTHNQAKIKIRRYNTFA